MDKKTQGKKNRASGADFERRVRKDLEDKGWIVDKWSNTVELVYSAIDTKPLNGKLTSSKHKFRGAGIPMAMGTGFPDFIAFKFHKGYNGLKTYEIMGVECKVGKYLDRIEKGKCEWLIKNNIFSKILIASKDKIKNRIYINYREYGSS